MEITINSGMKYTEILKELGKLDSQEIAKLGSAIEWYWAKQNLRTSIKLSNEEALIEFAHDLYMENENVSETQIMDSIVDNLNHTECASEYIWEKLFYEDADTIVEIARNYCQP